MCLWHNFISGVYSPISMKFGMKVGLWTLITGKILRSCYLGNGCHGDQKTFSEPYNGLSALHWGMGSVGRKNRKRTVKYVLSWKPTYCHSNQKYVFDSRIIAYFGIGLVYARFGKDGQRTLRYLLPWKLTCCHSNHKCGWVTTLIRIHMSVTISPE